MIYWIKWQTRETECEKRVAYEVSVSKLERGDMERQEL